MLKMLLLINELTCTIGNTILLVVICYFFAIRAHGIPLTVTGCVSSHLRARADALFCALFNGNG